MIENMPDQEGCDTRTHFNRLLLFYQHHRFFEFQVKNPFFTFKNFCNMCMTISLQIFAEGIGQIADSQLQL